MAVDEIDTTQIRNGVTVGGILEHERNFQRIADANGGDRASGKPGYDASAAYVVDRLTRAGYDVRQQTFTFPFFEELAPATATEITPTPKKYVVETMTYSGSGDVTGPLIPTKDVIVPMPPDAPPSTSNSGCEDSDFEAAPEEPSIALIQRGTCFFGDKAINADEAGYDAVIIFNEGQPGRTDVVQGTLGAPDDIPVVGMSYADGADLYEQTESGPVTMNVTTSTDSRNAETVNILGNSPTGDVNKTMVIGAHLDSVAGGPGINDNGSGSSTILEIAEELAELKAKPRNRVRFAFWGAEELGLLGSEHYVATRTDRQLNQIKANLNFDMVGSPNYVRFVYDGNGDGAEGNPVGPPGSAQIEDIFTEFFDSQDQESDPTPFNGRSDYGPFIAAGIPAGGLFTGAEGIKTARQAAVYGGIAGVAYDPNYHQPGDTIANLSTAALSEMGDAAAHATYTVARTRSGFFEDGSFRTAQAPKPKFDYSGARLTR